MQRPLPDNTQHSQQTDIPAPGGIRTRNPSKRAAVDPRLRPRGQMQVHLVGFNCNSSAIELYRHLNESNSYTTRFSRLKQFLIYLPIYDHVFQVVFRFTIYDCNFFWISQNPYACYMSQPFHTPSITTLIVFIILRGEISWLPLRPTQPPTQKSPRVFFGGGVKSSRLEVYHWPPTCVKVKNKWSYTSTPAILLQVVDTDDFC